MGLTAPTADLTGNTIADTYDQLLILDSTAGVVENTLKVVSTQIGKSALQLSDEQVRITGVDTANAAAFEVMTANSAASIFKVAADTPAVTIVGTLTVGADDLGHDVIFYGDTANGNMTWDTSEDDLVLNDSRLFVDQDVATVDAIVVDTEATSAHGLTIAGDALTTGSAAIFSTSCVNLATTAAGGLVEISSTGDTDTNSNILLFINNDHADSSGTVPLLLNQDANANALYIPVPANTTTSVLEIANANSLTTGSALKVEANGSSNADDNSVVAILQENASADKTVGILIKQQGDDASIELTGTGGGGILFNMGTDPDTAGSASSNVLDDYEEGTWTGVVKDHDEAAAMTMDTGGEDRTTGAYTKIGNIVFISGFLQSSSLGSVSGNISLFGLPFTANSQNNYQTSIYMMGGGEGYAITAGHSVGGYVNPSTTSIILTVTDATSGVTHMQESEWTADGGVMVMGHYSV